MGKGGWDNTDLLGKAKESSEKMTEKIVGNMHFLKTQGEGARRKDGGKKGWKKWADNTH